MHLTPYLAAFFFLASGVSAFLLLQLLIPDREPAVKALSGLVLWQLTQILPVQLLATAQLLGVVARVSIPALAGLQALILAIAIAWSIARRVAATEPSGSLHSGIVWPQYVWALALALFCSYLVFAVDIFSSFPNGFDALTYHLPVALHWLQTGSLAIPASKAWRFSLPGNAEIGMMVLLATGKDSAVVLVNCVALVVLGISTYLAAKRFTRGNDRAAGFITLLLVSIPMFEFQALSAYVDLFGTAFMAAAISLFLYRKQDSDTSDSPVSGRLIFLSAGACGISLGTKPIYDLYAAAYILFVLFLLYREPRHKPRLALAICSLSVGLLMASAFWFARATFTTGNPLFPMRVAVRNHVLLKGYAASQITDPAFDQKFVRTRAEWIIYPWTEWKRDPGYLLIPYGEGDGLGAVFASFVPIGLAFLFLRSLTQARRNPHDGKLLLSLAIALLAWWFFLSRVPRFGLPIVFLACVLAAPLIEVLIVHRARSFAILFSISVVFTCAISTLVPIHTLLSRVRSGRWTRPEFYSYPSLLDNLPAGSCVVNFTQSAEKNFALAGKGLHNSVVPSFEVPNPVTGQFLQEHDGCFIAEIVSPATESQLPRNSDLALVNDQNVPMGKATVHWRVWKINPAGADKPERSE